MNLKKNKILFTILIILHTFWMMFLSYLWLNTPYSYDWESKSIAYTNIFKNIFLGLEEKPSKDSLLFVNVSYDKMLVPRFDEEGFESGNIAITNRVSLLKFFEIINNYPNYKFIIVDLFFEDSTSYDSLLQVQLAKSKDIILPYHMDGGEVILKNRFNALNGLADYDSDFGTFLKYTYIQKDSLQTVPLVLYKKYNQGDIIKTGPFYTSNGSLALNSLTLDFPIRSYDIFTNDSIGYNSVHLCELINLPPPFISELTKGKIIVIGDFKDRDIHPTVYGSTAGPLIQINAYYALVNGDHILSWSVLLFIFLNYLIISLFLFAGNSIRSFSFLNKFKSSNRSAIILEFLKYFFFLFLINVFGYLLFDIHLNVLIMGVYIVFVEFMIQRVNALLTIKMDKK